MHRTGVSFPSIGAQHRAGRIGVAEKKWFLVTWRGAHMPAYGDDSGIERGVFDGRTPEEAIQLAHQTVWWAKYMAGNDTTVEEIGRAPK